MLRRSFLLVPLVAFILLAGASPVTAQAEPGVFLLKSVEDDGFAVVGTPVEFGYVILNAQGVPAAHTTAMMRVVQNGVTLFETTDVSSHDYDGVNTFLITFPTTGPYHVHVDAGDAGTLDFEGYAMPRRDDASATHALAPVGSPVEGRPTPFDVAVTDAQGQIIPHRDVLVEIRRPGDQWLIFRTILHQHEEPTGFEYTFPQSGNFLIRAVGYTSSPREDRAQFDPVATTLDVEVADASPTETPPGARMAPAVDQPGPYQLLQAIDPQDTNTPFSRFVLSGILYDPEAGGAVPHVNYAIEVFETTTGYPIFRSEGLHAYDGQQEVVVNLGNPGRYAFVATASMKDGSWKATAVREFTVATTVPLVTSVGAVIVSATGLDQFKSGEPTEVVFSTKNLAGQPAQHAEVDFHVVREAWGVPLFQNKLHSHGPGVQPVTLTLPEPGEYLLIVNPVTIHGEPTPQYYWQEVGGALVVPLTVAEGPGLPAMLPREEPLEAGEAKTLPGPPLPLVLALVGAVALAWTRRRD